MTDSAPLAADLNAAGVPNWKDRLRDARSRDIQEYVKGVMRPKTHYDIEWAWIKQQFRERVSENQETQ